MQGRAWPDYGRFRALARLLLSMARLHHEASLMSIFSNPFDSSIHLHSRCNCGRHASQQEHDAQAVTAADAAAAAPAEGRYERVVAQAGVRALSPAAGMRRRVPEPVGIAPAAAAGSAPLPPGAA